MTDEYHVHSRKGAFAFCAQFDNEPDASMHLSRIFARVDFSSMLRARGTAVERLTISGAERDVEQSARGFACWIDPQYIFGEMDEGC